MTKRADKKKMKLAAASPAENTQVWVPFLTIDDGTTCSENSVFPCQSSRKEGEIYAIACEQRACVQGVQGVEAKMPRHCEREGGTIYDQPQDTAFITPSDGLAPPASCYNALNIPLESTSAPPTSCCCCAPFAPDAVLDPIPDECAPSSANRFTLHDVEPLPLSCNGAIVDKDLMTALSSFSCSSNMGGGGDAGSIDVALSAIFLDFLEDSGLDDYVDLAPVQPADWMF